MSLFVELQGNRTTLGTGKTVSGVQIVCGIVTVQDYYDRMEFSALQHQGVTTSEHPGVFNFHLGARDSCGNKVLTNASLRAPTPLNLNLR